MKVDPSPRFGSFGPRIAVGALGPWPSGWTASWSSGTRTASTSTCCKRRMVNRPARALALSMEQVDPHDEIGVRESWHANGRYHACVPT